MFTKEFFIKVILVHDAHECECYRYKFSKVYNKALKRFLFLNSSFIRLKRKLFWLIICPYCCFTLSYATHQSFTDAFANGSVTMNQYVWRIVFVYGSWNMVFIDIHMILQVFLNTIRHWLLCKDENVFILYILMLHMLIKHRGIYSFLVVSFRSAFFKKKLIFVSQIAFKKIFLRKSNLGFSWRWIFDRSNFPQNVA